MSIFQTNISLLNKFLKQFSSCFSKKQLAMFTLLIYALLKMNKAMGDRSFLKVFQGTYDLTASMIIEVYFILPFRFRVSNFSERWIKPSFASHFSA